MQKQADRALSSAGAPELIKSMFRFSWAQSLFGLQQLGGFWGSDQAMQRCDKVAKAAEAELSESVRNFFRMGDRVQRQTVDVLSSSSSLSASGNAAPVQTPGQQPATPSRRVNSGSLNTSSFVVLGEGLAAGMGDFTL